MRILIVCLLNILTTIFFESASTQNKISGKVMDQSTGEPVPYASVFFAGTTHGASTDVEGNYVFSGFASGKYDLTASSVGYQPYSLVVAFSESQQVINITLNPQPKVLSEITVKPDTLNWKRNYEDFLRHFLGTSSYARHAIIQNPKDIHLYFDVEKSVLVAHAKKPIIIDNRATGYRIYYHLYQFEWRVREGIFTVYGSPQFELLVAKRKSLENRWERERLKVFEGSLMHFMRSWHEQRWTREGFTVSRFYRVPNKERPSDEFLNKKIAALRMKQQATGQPLVIRTNGSDSLSYYFSLRSKPKEKDSVVNEVLSGDEFNAVSGSQKKFSGMLRVTYRKNEDAHYAALVGRAGKMKRQQSILHVLHPIAIYPNGYFDPVKGVFLEGYWSWSEKIATLLPLDYQPPGK